MTQREEFEEFVRTMDGEIYYSHYYSLERLTHRYASEEVELAWRVWQHQERAISCARCEGGDVNINRATPKPRPGTNCCRVAQWTNGWMHNEDCENWVLKY